MRPPGPLPPALQGKTFTRQQALAVGVPDKRLRARDVVRITRGIYRHVMVGLDGDGASALPARQARRGPGRDLDIELLRAICSRAPGLWLSHTTAARLMGLPLPPWLDADPLLHVSGAFRSGTLAGIQGVRQHGPVKNIIGEVLEEHRLCMSTPERVLIELMPVLGPDDLVALGDALVRIPREEFEGRREPWTTRSRLLEGLNRHGHTRGIVAARHALTLVRVGADSRPETLLRLRLAEAGLPEPELQARLYPDDPRSPSTDLAYRRERVAVQYDGVHHFSAEQQAIDQWRDAEFQGEGWTVISSNVVDLRSQFVVVVGRVSGLLAS